MQSVSRSTTTLNLNINVKLFVHNKFFSQWHLLKWWRSYFFETFECCLTFSNGKILLSIRRLFNFQPERDDQVRVSVRVKIILILVDVLGISETILCEQGSTCYGLEGSLYGLKTFFIWGICLDQLFGLSKRRVSHMQSRFHFAFSTMETPISTEVYCNGCFPYQCYLLYIKDKWFAFLNTYK